MTGFSDLFANTPEWMKFISVLFPFVTIIFVFIIYQHFQMQRDQARWRREDERWLQPSNTLGLNAISDQNLVAIIYRDEGGDVRVRYVDDGASIIEPISGLPVLHEK